MKTADIGKLGENLAARFLSKNGYRVVERNRHFSHNELDIIVRDSSYIVFVEVKTRTVDESLYSPFGSPASAVTKEKQKRTVAAARAYLAKHSRLGLQPRFDVVEVYLSQEHRLLHINHITNAFGA